MTPPPAEQFAARIFIGPALRAQPDRRLVDLVRDGYDAAFEEIVRRYRRPLDRFAAAIVGGRSEDVTQDAFSKALLALRGSEAEIELRPWLYRIVRNTALNDLRDRAPAAEELPETLPGGRSTAAEVEAREELTDLMERLRALPEPQRAAIVMRELEGLSHEEIAAALGVTGGAARQAIFRARAALRDGLGLLVPMPLLRTLAEHGDDLARTGTIAAGASSAGGAALGGLGGGALKAGMATVLIAGAVGAGVAVEHHRGEGAGPQAAEAAPLVADKTHGDGNSSTSAAGASENSSFGNGRHGRGSDDRGTDDHQGNGGDGGQRGGSLDSGSGGGPGPSGNSGSGSHNSGSGSDSGDHHGGSGSGSGGSGGDGSGHGGSGSGDGSGDDHGGSLSSGSGSNDGSGSHGGSGDSGSGGSDSGEISEPAPIVEPSGSDDGSGGSGSGSGSSGDSGSGDLGSLDGSSGSEISP
jgi:RNA polymerase sigma factor (sigma-70 family)